MPQNHFMIFSSDGRGPYQHLPQLPFPLDEGDDEWRTRVRDRVWYHTLPTERLELVERDGLKPDNAERCVHLSVLPMEELIRGYWRVHDVTVLQVSLENLPDEHVTPGYDDMEYCLAITCPIPPQNLKRQELVR